jgi:hypothetical protein
MGMKKKFILEFDEVPAFVFVSHNGSTQEQIYKHGEEVKEWKALTVRSRLEDITTHEIEYVTLNKRG